MEQAIADKFNSYMAKAAQNFGARFSAFSLGGQDRDAGADYLLSDSSRFALIEFKANVTLLKTEAKKPRREELCRQLAGNPGMRDLHDICHYITFANDAGYVVTNIYRNEICNKSTFPALLDSECCTPSRHMRLTAIDYSRSFFEPNSKATLGLEEFEQYLSWVMKETSGSTAGTVSLLVYDPDDLELKIAKVSSVAEAYEWMQANLPPAPSDAPSGPGGW